MTNEINFFIKNKLFAVKLHDGKITPQTTLNEYLRDYLHLTGTKKMCLEGGCGSCVVAVKKPDPLTGKFKLVAINSCLVSILTCHGWHIDTIEAIGDASTKYHTVQETLAKFNGTQCGFCSPGMVMNAYALYENKKDQMTKQEVEDSFGGNICRCTGYRPILDAFKSLCKDEEDDFEFVKMDPPDIEDIAEGNCKDKNKVCTMDCPKCPIRDVNLTFGKVKWTKVFYLKDLLNALKTIGTSSYMLVAGNTAKGVYKLKSLPSAYIDIIEVKELLGHTISDDGNLILGANMSLADSITLFNLLSKSYKQFAYLKNLAKHIELVANLSVRNMASLAGNLMLKYQHREFPSDIFLILETVAAQLRIVNVDGTRSTKSLVQFLNIDMRQKVIEKIILKPLTEDFKFKSYKIMPRAQNVHALINAGFLFKLNKGIVEDASIIFGNISPDFIHATNCEKFLIGKKLFQNDTLQNVLRILSQELKPKQKLLEPSIELKKQMPLALFYKAVLSLMPQEDITPSFRNGGHLLKRPISKGSQEYETIKAMFPVTQPIPKIEALAQTTGQAQYIDDIPELPNQLYAKFVLAKAPPTSKILKINPSKALEIDGVVAFYSKDDIPGENNFMLFPPFYIKEEIFCDDIVKFYGQPIGLLVAENQDVLDKAVNFVKVTYGPPKDPVFTTIKDIIKANYSDKLLLEIITSPTRRGKNVKHKVDGSFNIGGQYHFHMETQCCNIVPTEEDGLDIYAPVQYMDYVQWVLSTVLKVPQNKLNVIVRRCGGSFGAKVTRTNLLICASAIPAWKLRRPVRMSLSLSENMIIIGKRFPLMANYDVGVDDAGTIQYLNIDMYTDVGIGGNEALPGFILEMFKQYVSDTYHIKFYYAHTDTHSNTWARAPGNLEGFACIESIMDHIAYTINVDPISVRLANLSKQADSMFNQIYRMTTDQDKTHKKIRQYVDDIKAWANIYERKNEIDNFNQENRWKKKGLSVVPMAWNFFFFQAMTAHVSVYHGDGSVAISHSGIEMGQGVNTKAAQICAYKFGILLQKVEVFPCSANVSPNAVASGQSRTSEGIAFAVMQACDYILEKMKPYKKSNITWEQWVQTCHSNNVRLTAEGVHDPFSPNIKPYKIYGVCATEVIVDILTGQHIISRVDIIEDAGRSISPLIDIGQVEGAFVMGMGYFTSENVIFDEYGKVATDSTWNYWPPGAKDIPVDFRIKFPKNNPNPVGVMFSKATGEPPICLSVSVPLAIRYALASARADSDRTQSRWYPFDGPSSVENTFINSLNNPKQYLI